MDIVEVSTTIDEHLDEGDCLSYWMASLSGTYSMKR
jgi:hypothetical protein